MSGRLVVFPILFVIGLGFALGYRIGGQAGGFCGMYSGILVGGIIPSVMENILRRKWAKAAQPIPTVPARNPWQMPAPPRALALPVRKPTPQTARWDRGLIISAVWKNAVLVIGGLLVMTCQNWLPERNRLALVALWVVLVTVAVVKQAKWKATREESALKKQLK